MSNSNRLRVNGLIVLNSNARVLFQLHALKVDVKDSFYLQYSQGTILVKLTGKRPLGTLFT